MKAVYARSSTSVALPHGGVVSVMEGTHWSADDPVVLLHPELFSEDARYGMLFSHPLEAGDYPGAPSGPVIEQATATPGDIRRNVDRSNRRG